MQKKKFTPPNVINPIAKWQWWLRNIILREKRNRLNNENFSIISCNCLGAMITHDLLQPQLSPTVNLFIKADDFIRFVSNIEEYLKYELIEAFDERMTFPVGKLKDVKIYFVHYKTFEEAKKKWQERRMRIRWDNLFLIFCEKDGCTYDHLLTFDALPYENKVVIVHKPYPEIKCSYYFPGYEKTGEIGEITQFKGLFGKRIYDKWDYVSFLNK